MLKVSQCIPLLEIAAGRALATGPQKRDRGCVGESRVKSVMIELELL